MKNLSDKTSTPAVPVVAVVGLGYVGLPLAVEFGKRYPTIGFDLSEEKVTTDPRRLASADFVIVAVPTPVDAAHIPVFPRSLAPAPPSAGT